jgi:hypothetical protein
MEVEKDVTINVTNEFDPYDDYCRRPNNVRHVDRSGLPQFTVTEETVIGLKESREVFRDFDEIGGFDDVPIGFLTIAKKLIWKYQRVLTKKASQAGGHAGGPASRLASRRTSWPSARRQAGGQAGGHAGGPASRPAS